MSAAVRYDPYGALRPGSATPSGFGFTGEWTDPSGMLNLRARGYSGSLGRFVSADTWGGIASNPLTANAYAFGTDNPLNYTDPSGHVGKAIHFGLMVLSMAVMMIPGVGAVYSLACAATGTDLITGDHLSEGERLMYALGALPLVGPIGRILGKIGGRMLAMADRCLGAGMKAFGEGARVLGNLGRDMSAEGRALGEGERAMSEGARLGAGAREEAAAAERIESAALSKADRPINLAERWDRAARNAARADGVPGYQDVIVHGSPVDFGRSPEAWERGANMSAHEVASLIRDNPAYRGGPIRLIACEAGKGEGIAAQNLANELGVKVLAPTENVYPTRGGALPVHSDAGTPGSWLPFYPQVGK